MLYCEDLVSLLFHFCRSGIDVVTYTGAKRAIPSVFDSPTVIVTSYSTLTADLRNLIVNGKESPFYKDMPEEYTEYIKENKTKKKWKLRAPGLVEAFGMDKKFMAMFMDESHTIRNYDTLTNQAMQGVAVQCKYVVHSTGTYHINKKEDFLSQFQTMPFSYEYGAISSLSAKSSVIADVFRKLAVKRKLGEIKNQEGQTIEKLVKYVPIDPDDVKGAYLAKKSLMHCLEELLSDWDQVRADERYLLVTNMLAVMAKMSQLSAAPASLMGGNVTGKWTSRAKVSPPMCSLCRKSTADDEGNQGELQPILLRCANNHPRCQKCAIVDQREGVCKACEHMTNLGGSPQNVQAAVSCSNKTKWIVSMVKNSAEKFIVFSGFTTVLDCVYLALREVMDDVLIERLDGLMQDQDRNAALSRINKGSAKVLLATIQTGGLGLTITGANNVIVMDQWWNFNRLHQGFGRVFRHGQTKDCTLYILIERGTKKDSASVDECQMEMSERKAMEGERMMEGKTMNASETISVAKTLCSKSPKSTFLHINGNFDNDVYTADSDCKRRRLE